MSKHYEKLLNRSYNHRAPIQMLDYIKLLEEKSYFSKLSDSHADEYERLIDDIIQGESFFINGKEYQCFEVINGVKK